MSSTFWNVQLLFFDPDASLESIDLLVSQVDQVPVGVVELVLLGLSLNPLQVAGVLFLDPVAFYKEPGSIECVKGSCQTARQSVRPLWGLFPIRSAPTTMRRMR